MEAEQIFKKFKSLHPLNGERFLNTDSNVYRWLWHIKEREALQTKKPVQIRQSKKFLRLKERRAVSAFSDFPEYMQQRYAQIAGCFPGHKVYAVGSRVKGDYVERWDNDEIRNERAANWKKDKRESDYDFTVDGYPEPVTALPVGSDYTRGKIAENEKVELPMFDFSKLPPFEHGGVIAAMEANDLKHIVEIHNKYGLSPYNYCCDITGLKNWFVWAIETGLIKDNGETAEPTTDAPGG